MGVSFPHTQHADSENSLGEVSFQKPDIIVCCNSREGGSGGNAFFCKDFCIAARLVCLYFSGFPALYFCTAARLVCLHFSGFPALYFCTAIRCLFLKFSPCLSWYFLTAIKLDNLLLFSFASKSIFSKIDTKFEQ